MWLELHQYAFAKWTTPEDAKQWYADWHKRVRRYSGCAACYKAWERLVEQHPPDFSSPDAFFLWTVDRHNDVNVRLKKPAWHLDDAREYYQPGAPGQMSAEERRQTLVARPTQSKLHDLWLELHRHRLSSDTGQWFDDWIERVSAHACTCQSKAEDYLAQDPPPLDDDEAWFFWGVRFHDSISREHSHAPLYSEADAAAMFRPEYYQEQSDILIMTIAVGSEAAADLRLTRPSQELYAERCGADYLVLADKTEDWWGYEKFRVRPWAERYDRTLFIDSDVLIREDAENLFDLVPEGMVGIHNDIPFIDQDLAWLQHDRYMCSRATDRVIEHNDRRCFNSGVVLCDRQDAEIWERPDRKFIHFPCNHSSEQTWVDSNIGVRPVFELPWRFNCQRYWPAFEELAPDAAFIHFAGCKNVLFIDRQKEIKQWL